MSKTNFHYRTNIRANWWHLKNSVTFFITINVRSKCPSFGHIRNEIMCLSHEGAIAHACWNEIPFHFPFIALDEFVVMPDHLHGILTMNCADAFKYYERKAKLTNTLSTEMSIKMSAISPKGGSISTVVRSYKSAVSNQIHITNPDFAWQPLYYDRII